MYLQASLYVFSVLFSISLFLSSRHLVTSKRWYDPVFFQGLAFFFWGSGQFIALVSHEQYETLSNVLIFFFYLFAVLSFRFFPLPPHLYFSRWKTYVDVGLLTVLYVTCLANIWIIGENTELYCMVIHIQTGIFVLGCGLPLVHMRISELFERSNWTLLGLLCFVVMNIFDHLLPWWVTLLPFLVFFTLILLGLDKVRDIEDIVDVQEESLFLFEKLQFNLRDQKALAMHAIVAFFIFLNMPIRPDIYVWGIVVFLGILGVRWVFTNHRNNALMKEVSMILRDLEMQFTENMNHIRSQNIDLSQLLSLKQSYETLLITCKEQSMQTIHSENVYDMIEEIVQEWYITMVGLRYVRVLLQSSEGEVFYETRRGNEKLLEGDYQEYVTLKLAIDEASDDSSPSQFVIVEAMSATADKTDREFLNHLLIHVRGLFQRSIQLQQSLDLRIMEQEMELASKIQLSLIPKEKLVLPHLEAKAVYVPVQYVGGDYVDFLVINDRYSCFLVADVSGHGIPASLLTTGIRNSFRAVIQTSFQPHEILYRLNRLLYEDLSKTRSYVTMVVAVVDTFEGVIWTSRAGHPAPLYLSRTKQKVLSSKGGIGLGLMKDAAYSQEKLVLEEDFTLIIYTDGLTDLGRTEDNVLDSEQWLKLFTNVYNSDKFNENGDRIYEMEQLVKETIHQHQQDDDISLLILDVKKFEQK